MIQSQEMKKEWYIKINEESEGPYSIQDLKDDPRITLDTLAWKKGMPGWLKIREIPELLQLFEPEKEELKGPGPEGVLTIEKDPDFLIWWLMAILLVLVILLYFYFP